PTLAPVDHQQGNDKSRKIVLRHAEKHMLRIKKEPAVTVAIEAKISHFETAEDERTFALADASCDLHIGCQVSAMQIILAWIIRHVPPGAMQLRQQHHRTAQAPPMLPCIGFVTHLLQHRTHVRTRELRVDDTGM